MKFFTGSKAVKTCPGNPWYISFQGPGGIWGEENKEDLSILLRYNSKNLDQMASPCPNFEESLSVMIYPTLLLFFIIFHQRHNNRYMANIFISCNRNYIINKIYN